MLNKKNIFFKKKLFTIHFTTYDRFFFVSQKLYVFAHVRQMYTAIELSIDNTHRRIYKPCIQRTQYTRRFVKNVFIRVVFGNRVFSKRQNFTFHNN